MHSFCIQNVGKMVSSIHETFFFFQKDLHTGKLVNLPRLITASDRTPFLPDRVAKSVLFSSGKVPEILNQTREADSIDETIRGCGRESINGEQEFCATSFPS